MHVGDRRRTGEVEHGLCERDIEVQDHAVNDAQHP